MKASVILAHPYKNSFNHAIYNEVCSTFFENKIEIYKHDLYEERFNPVLSVEELSSDKSVDLLVKKYADELIDTDCIVFIHPNWWGQPPAILKGYIDRIIRPPYAYDFLPDDNGGGLPVKKLKCKCGIVFNTSNTPELRENTYFNDPLENIWKKCVFGFCGIEKYFRKIFRVIADSDDELRRKWLLEVKNIILSKTII
ncbi:MAG TPA: NAD(P)H-dependent oxidoreductase [bacterium]|nr:NAD(P)H-dependent oxidoreductase [bacterium]HPN30905.1 NAD(P)H-dependent oxidoreductase [bacterium]